MFQITIRDGLSLQNPFCPLPPPLPSFMSPYVQPDCCLLLSKLLYQLSLCMSACQAFVATLHRPEWCEQGNLTMWSFVIADAHSKVLIRSHGEVIVCSSSQPRQQKGVDLHQIKRIMESACVGFSIPAYDTCPTISHEIVGGCGLQCFIVRL